MIDSYIKEYKEFSIHRFPYSRLNFDNLSTNETLQSMFKSIEIIDVFSNSTAILDSWVILKLNELKNQLLISLYYLPHYSSFLFASLQRSISELILKITLYSSVDTPKTEETQNKINNMQFRILKDNIKASPEYNTQLFKIQLDNFFSLYGNSSNNIHLKEASSVIECIEAYNSITQSDIKLVKGLAIKVETYLLSFFPKLHNLNDTQLNMSSKIQLKNILSKPTYIKYFN
ncbi:hypothetical protein [Lysinibacillus sp. BSL11]